VSTIAVGEQCHAVRQKMAREHGRELGIARAVVRDLGAEHEVVARVVGEPREVARDRRAAGAVRVRARGGERERCRLGIDHRHVGAERRRGHAGKRESAPDLERAAPAHVEEPAREVRREHARARPEIRPVRRLRLAAQQRAAIDEPFELPHRPERDRSAAALDRDARGRLARDRPQFSGGTSVVAIEVQCARDFSIVPRFGPPRCPATISRSAEPVSTI
jgi:hypothetical protein